MASLRNEPKEPFRFKMLGQLAAIGQRTGVAEIFGFQFSGLIAWLMWRTIYLMKLPRLEKKIQVALHWTMDLFFSRDLAQIVTVSGLENAGRKLEAIKATASGRAGHSVPAMQRVGDQTEAKSPAGALSV